MLGSVINQSKALGEDMLIQIFKKMYSPFNFYWAFKVLKHTTPNTFQFTFLLEHGYNTRSIPNYNRNISIRYILKAREMF
jgi:hypothetical protein